MIKKTDSGWLVDIQPEGRGGRRYRKTLPTKAEALRWEAYIREKIIQTPDWQPARKDIRRLSALAEIWYEAHGRHLKASKKTYNRLKYTIKMLGDPIAASLSTITFIEYRTRRIEAGCSEASMNREHAHLRAMFNELVRLGHWKGSNPLQGIRQFKEQQKERGYLNHQEIATLLNTLKGDGRRVTLLCLTTGARWGEAEKLRAENVTNGLVTFTDTKNGRNRSIPIQKSIEQEIKTKNIGRLFKPCYHEFRSAIARTGLKLPEHQMTHILRHTFASHFMIKGGNILTLQRILGHQSLTMTMRYAHLAPDHLQEAIRLNPLGEVDTLLTVTESRDKTKFDN